MARAVPGLVTILTWTHTGTANGVADDAATVLPVPAGAKTILCQVHSTKAGNTASDFDVKAFASLDGENVDNYAFHTEENFGDGYVKTFSLPVGPAAYQFKLDVAAGDGYVDMYVQAVL